MRYPQLVLGMLGIFVYVGVEVTIVSNLSELLKQPRLWRISIIGSSAIYFICIGEV